MAGVGLVDFDGVVGYEHQLVDAIAQLGWQAKKVCLCSHILFAGELLELTAGLEVAGMRSCPMVLVDVIERTRQQRAGQVFEGKSNSGS